MAADMARFPPPEKQMPVSEVPGGGQLWRLCSGNLAAVRGMGKSLAFQTSGWKPEFTLAMGLPPGGIGVAATVEELIPLICVNRRP
jgi:hypothetical protein